MGDAVERRSRGGRKYNVFLLGPLVVPFLTPLWGEGSPTKIDYRKKGTLILTSRVAQGCLISNIRPCFGVVSGREDQPICWISEVLAMLRD